ncbi:hypothetical protein [Bdellovibrio sp. HCB209]|uniref:hypothetical protein n=1 Tax=Bdellovibrio sp. HCB209 TaxID=3394354 RepID=UPI0039B58F45
MSNKCPFCKEKARVETHMSFQNLHSVLCEICGAYAINDNLLFILNKQKLNPSLLNCVKENIQTNHKTKINTAWLSDSTSDETDLTKFMSIKHFDFFYSLPIEHSNKLTDILILISEKTKHQHPFQSVEFTIKDLYQLKIVDAQEFAYWIEMLKNSELVDIPGYIGMALRDMSPQLTPKGWLELDRIRNESGLNSKKAFIAMQFNWGDELAATKNAYIETVKEACLDCGYEANIVTEHHTGHIVDRIIAEIKEAKFIIADFTFNNRGAYFEAGYARALGKHVIHTVMDGHTDGDDKEGKKLHFDIQQINYIKWSDPKELRERIRDRIKAVIE